MVAEEHTTLVWVNDSVDGYEPGGRRFESVVHAARRFASCDKRDANALLALTSDDIREFAIEGKQAFANRRDLGNSGSPFWQQMAELLSDGSRVE